MKLNVRRCLKIWKGGFVKEFKRPCIRVVLICFSLLLSLSVLAQPSYKSVLKKWTRHDRVFVLENFEERLNWHATYLSEEFREARRKKLTNLYEWTDQESVRRKNEDRDEADRYDTFFLGIYSGSSVWPEIGKDTGKWKMVLEAEGRPVAESVRLERVPMTQLERTLFPYLEKWSHAFIVQFPKTIQAGKPFRLRMTGIPARSELVWKNP